MILQIIRFEEFYTQLGGNLLSLIVLYTFFFNENSIKFNLFYNCFDKNKF
jgi:hypothetical protein